MKLIRTMLVSFAGVVAASHAHAEDSSNWQLFRGPHAGVSETKGLPSEWDTKKNVTWSVTVPGRGWSSPVVWGDRIFLTSVTSEGKVETPKPGLYFGGERMKPSEAVHHWMVYCLDLKTGKTLWEREAAKGPPSKGIHSKNSYASETPVTDGKRIYAYFGNQCLFCFDMNGDPVWSRKWDVVPTKFSWGTAASPVLYKDRLYIVNDNETRSFLACINAEDGKQLWEVERDEKSNWATPFIWENDKRVELITSGSNRVRSYDLDGKLLWELGGMSSITIPTPFAAHGLLYVGSGYVMDKRKPLFVVRPGAQGDISLKEGQMENNFVAWSRPIAPYNPSPVVYGDNIYVVYDMGFLSCYDAKTGKPRYEKERIPGKFTVSPWAYDGKIFCLNEDGETIVVEAGPTFKILHKNKLEEMCMACPAVAGKSLLIRTIDKLYKIDAPNN
jgi:outer membrane protein assembly factor BamB